MLRGVMVMCICRKHCESAFPNLISLNFTTILVSLHLADEETETQKHDIWGKAQSFPPQSNLRKDKYEFILKEEELLIVSKK